MSKCNCKSEIEAKLLERFKTQQPDASQHKVTLKGYGFGVEEKSGALVVRGFIPYEAFALVPLKKGGSKPKKTMGNMFFSYCPYCGAKT